MTDPITQDRYLQTSIAASKYKTRSQHKRQCNRTSRRLSLSGFLQTSLLWRKMALQQVSKRLHDNFVRQLHATREGKRFRKAGLLWPEPIIKSFACVLCLLTFAASNLPRPDCKNIPCLAVVAGSLSRGPKTQKNHLRCEERDSLTTGLIQW